jgi:hypothetical protein
MRKGKIDLRKAIHLAGGAPKEVDIRRHPVHYSGVGYYFTLADGVYLTPSGIWSGGEFFPEVPDLGDEVESNLRTLLRKIEASPCTFPVQVYGVEDVQGYYREAWKALFPAVAGGREFKVEEVFGGKRFLVVLTPKSPLETIDGDSFVMQEFDIPPFKERDKWIYALLMNLDQRRGNMTPAGPEEFPFGVLEVTFPGIASVVEDWLREVR